MMRIGLLLIVILGLVGLGVFFAPASLLGSMIEKATGNRLTLSETRGSVWKGSGFLSMMDKNGERYALTPAPIVWQIEKMPLFWGEIVGVLAFNESRELPESGLKTTFRISREAGEINHLKTPINLATVLKLIGKLDLLQLGGSLNLNLPQWRWEEGLNTMKGTVTWSNVRSAVVPLGTVGTYDIHFQAAASPAIGIQLETVSGPLILEAKGNIVPGEGYRVDGSAQTDEAHRGPLQAIMMLLGTDQGGKRYFSYSS